MMKERMNETYKKKKKKGGIVYRRKLFAEQKE